MYLHIIWGWLCGETEAKSWAAPSPKGYKSKPQTVNGNISNVCVVLALDVQMALVQTSQLYWVGGSLCGQYFLLIKLNKKTERIHLLLLQPLKNRVTPISSDKQVYLPNRDILHCSSLSHSWLWCSGSGDTFSQVLSFSRGGIEICTLKYVIKCAKLN